MDALDRFDVLYRWITEDGDFEEILAEYLAGLPDHRRHWAGVVARQIRDEICRGGGVEYLRVLRADPGRLSRALADYIR